MEDVGIEEFFLGCTENVYLSPVTVIQTGSVYQGHLGQPCLAWQHEEFQMGACGRAAPPNTHTKTHVSTHTCAHTYYTTHMPHMHTSYTLYITHSHRIHILHTVYIQPIPHMHIQHANHTHVYHIPHISYVCTNSTCIHLILFTHKYYMHNTYTTQAYIHHTHNTTHMYHIDIS